MRGVDFESIGAKVMANPVSRCAAKENRLRRNVCAQLESERKALGLSIRETARLFGTSVSQTQRLLGKEPCGSLTLRSIVRAADALGLEVSVALVSE